MINIFILNWNSATDVGNLLKSIEKSGYRKFRVLVIHNATDDKTEIEQLHSSYQYKFEVHLIINNENYGYAGGNNKGFEYLQKNNLEGDILILNPDVLIQPNTLQALTDAKNKAQAGAVMIRTYDETKRHLYDYVTLTGFKQTFYYSEKAICDTDYAAGSCLYLDRKTINKIGLFDPAFFMYWEEVDLSIRIKSQNKRIISTTNSFIIRKSNSSARSSNAIFYSIRNSFILKSKFDFKRLSHCKYIIKLMLSAILQSIRNSDIRCFWCFIKGWQAGYKLRSKNKL